MGYMLQYNLHPSLQWMRDTQPSRSYRESSSSPTISQHANASYAWQFSPNWKIMDSSLSSHQQYAEEPYRLDHLPPSLTQSTPSLIFPWHLPSHLTSALQRLSQSTVFRASTPSDSSIWHSSLNPLAKSFSPSNSQLHQLIQRIFPTSGEGSPLNPDAAPFVPGLWYQSRVTSTVH